VGKSAICEKLEIILKHLGAPVEWVGGKEEANLTLEEWSDYDKTPIEIVERVDHMVKVYETYTDHNGWLQVSQEEYDRTKDQYEHRIRRVSVPHLIDYQKVLDLILQHSEWTSHGYSIVDDNRNKFVDDLLALVCAKVERRDESRVKPVVKVSEIEPVGFLMKHRSGTARGFSWKKDDAQFSKDWQRVGMYSEDQVIVMLREAAESYDERAKKWRESFDAMHRRTMSAERQIAESNAMLDRVREAIQPQAGAFNTPTIPLEEAMKYAAPQGQEAGK
jgi:hypothetical protein